MMRHYQTQKIQFVQHGFSLLENLVALVLLTIGGLGIAASTITAISTNSDNQARAMALAAATKTLEPVYIRAQDPYPVTPGATDLHTLINNYVITKSTAISSGQTAVATSGGVVVKGNVAAGASDDFLVSVTQAVDAAGTDVLTAAGPYVSPVRVAVRVKYRGKAGRIGADGGVELSRDKEVLTSFTYVLGG